VIEKESRVREEVRVGKRSEVEKQTVSETVRKEDVEIEREDSDVLPESRLTAEGDRARTGRYEPKERSRS
jgi:stress response protein YsnF